MTSEYVALIGWDSFLDALRWVIEIFLILVTLRLFARRRENVSYRPAIIMLVVTIIATPFLLLEIIRVTEQPKQPEVVPVVPEAPEVEPETPVNPEPETEPSYSYDSEVIPATHRSVKPAEAPETPEVEPKPSPIVENYTLTFDANGGVGEMGAQNMVYDVEDQLTPNNFTRVGYTFSRWNTKADGTGADYADGATVKNLSTTGAATLYAIWTPDQDTPYKVYHYKMGFDVDSWTLAETDELTGESDKQIEPNVKSYEGFTAPAKQKVAIAADGSTEVSYQYRRNLYRLTVTDEQYTMGASSGDYYYLASVALSAKVRTGYTFTGWTDGTATTNLNFYMMGEKTVGPIYEANTYHIVFHGNTGVGSMAEQDIEYDQTVTLTRNSFTKQGYHFTGWSTSASGEVVYADMAEVKNLTDDGNFDLYAIWAPNTDTPYTIIHEQMNLDGSSYTVVLEEHLTGTTGETKPAPTKSYVGFTAPTAQQIEITPDGQASITYQYARNKYMLTLDDENYIEYKSHGTGLVFFGDTVTLRAKERESNLVFDKWTNGATDRELSFTMPSMNFEIGPKYKSDAFPFVFEHDGACTFNGIKSSEEAALGATEAGDITGENCADYAGQKYIDTGVQLYTSDNAHKDFYIEFTIDEFDVSKNASRATMMNSTKEKELYQYPGVVVRRNDRKDEILIGVNVVKDRVKQVNFKKTFTPASSVTRVRLVRKNDIICYAIGDGDYVYAGDNTLHNQYFETPTVMFGAAIDEQASSSPRVVRYLNGTLSGMKIRLGTDAQDTINCTKP